MSDGMTRRGRLWLALYDAAVTVDVALGAAYRNVSKRILEPVAGYAIERAGAATDWGDGADGEEWDDAP